MQSIPEGAWIQAQRTYFFPEGAWIQAQRTYFFPEGGVESSRQFLKPLQLSDGLL